MKGPVWSLALSMALGVWCAPWLVGSVAAVCVCFVLACVCVGWFRRKYWVWCAGFCLGMWAYGIQVEGPVMRGPVTVQGWVAGASGGVSADVRVGRWKRPGEAWQMGGGRVRVRFCQRPPVMGQRVVVFGYASPVTVRALPGAPDNGMSLALGRVRSRVRCALQWGSAGETDPSRPDNAGVLRALATGDRGGVSAETMGLLRRTGTAHLLAISGFHVGLMAWLAFCFSMGVQRLMTPLLERGFPTALHYFSSVGAAWLYALGAGFPVSAQRAALMVTLIAIAKAWNRKVPIGNLLGCAGVIVLLWDPAALASPGFQLSFMAIVGLAQCSTAILSRLGSVRGVWGWTAQSMAATLGATIGTMPVSCWWFQEVPPLSPLANLVAMPWVAWWIVPCAFSGVWLPEPFSGWAITGGDVGLRGLFFVLEFFDCGTWFIAVGPLGALLGVLGCLWNRKAWVIFLALWHVSCSTPPRGLVLTALNVGHGESVLLEFPDGRNWLVDGGPSSRDVVQYLRRAGIGRLDVLVVSHWHADHTGGVRAILEGLDVGEVWAPSPRDGWPTGPPELFSWMRLKEIPVRFAPSGTFQATGLGGMNDNSLVVEVTWEKWKLLFTGDIGVAAEKQLMERLSPPYDLLKIPHHGSSTSSSEAFIDAVQPRYGLLSVGDRFGLPEPDVMERYARRRIPVFNTAVMGTVQMEFTESRMYVWGHRSREGWLRMRPAFESIAP